MIRLKKNCMSAVVRALSTQAPPLFLVVIIQGLALFGGVQMGFLFHLLQPRPLFWDHNVMWRLGFPCEERAEVAAEYLPYSRRDIRPLRSNMFFIRKLVIFLVQATRPLIEHVRQSTQGIYFFILRMI